MTQYVGNSPSDVLDGFIKRYFYGIRRNDDGELFLIRLDQLGQADTAISINELGEADGNFPDFEEGIDYLDGLDEEHNILYANLRYPQFKWDGRSLLYYVDQTDGQFVLQGFAAIYDISRGVMKRRLHSHPQRFFFFSIVQ